MVTASEATVDTVDMDTGTVDMDMVDMDSEDTAGTEAMGIRICTMVKKIRNGYMVKGFEPSERL